MLMYFVCIDYEAAINMIVQSLTQLKNHIIFLYDLVQSLMNVQMNAS